MTGLKPREIWDAPENHGGGVEEIVPKRSDPENLIKGAEFSFDCLKAKTQNSGEFFA